MSRDEIQIAIEGLVAIVAVVLILAVLWRDGLNAYRASKRAKGGQR